LRALRQAWPGAEVTVVGLRAGEWLRDRFPGYIDRWLSCDAWPGLPEVDGSRAAAERFLRRARACRFDLALQMHGSGQVTNGLTAALGARRWVGLAETAEGGSPVGGPVGGEVQPYPDDRHEVERCLAVVQAAGVVAGDQTLEFPLRPDDVEQAGTWLPPGERVAVVHPGASVPERRWDAAGFARVIEHLVLAREPAVERVVLTGGPGEEAVAAAVTDRLPPVARARVLDLTGATPLGPLAALLARAVLVVANDTGIVHLAAAVGTPVVAVGGGSDWTRWRPWGSAHRAVGGPDAGGWPTPDAVLEAVGFVVATSDTRAVAGAAS
jgi:ADP-heptose:LPS heptosyltransferase